MIIYDEIRLVLWLKCCTEANAVVPTRRWQRLKLRRNTIWIHRPQCVLHVGDGGEGTESSLKSMVLQAEDKIVLSIKSRWCFVKPLFVSPT